MEVREDRKKVSTTDSNIDGKIAHDRELVGECWKDFTYLLEGVVVLLVVRHDEEK